MIRRVLAVIAAGCTALLAAGCAGDSRPHRPMQLPTTETEPTDMVPFVGYMDDTNSNGYRDTIVVTVYLFARDKADASMYAPGSLDFILTGKSGKVLHKWSLPPDVVAGLAKRMSAGPAYFVRLSLLDGSGTDVCDDSTADLQIRFTTKSGAVVGGSANGIIVGKITRG